MRRDKALFVHGGLFALAAVLAWRASVAEEGTGSASEVELWKFDTDALQRVLYEDERRRVELLPQRDAVGRYLVGKVAHTPAPAQASTGSSASTPDAGAAALLEAEPEGESVESKSETFIGVSDANELVDSLVNLRALRALGTVGPDKLEDFGLVGEDTSRLLVEFTAGPKELLFGGRTPGGGDFYVQQRPSGEVYVISGDIRRDVELAQSRLMERELLTVPEGTVVERVVLEQGGTTRTIVRSNEHPSFWTDETAPAEKDETLTNWMKKFERLRINEYVEGEPEAYEPLVVASFMSGDEALGSIEFGQQPNSDGKPRYLARSPQSRWWGVVLASSGSQLAEDLPTILQ